MSAAKENGEKLKREHENDAESMAEKKQKTQPTGDASCTSLAVQAPHGTSFQLNPTATNFAQGRVGHPTTTYPLTTEAETFMAGNPSAEAIKEHLVNVKESTIVIQQAQFASIIDNKNDYETMREIIDRIQHREAQVRELANQIGDHVAASKVLEGGLDKKAVEQEKLDAQRKADEAESKLASKMATFKKLLAYLAD